MSPSPSFLSPFRRTSRGWIGGALSWLPGLLFTSGSILLAMGILRQGHREREAALSLLLSETREASEQLEGLLDRLDGELAVYPQGHAPGEGPGGSGPADPQGRVGALARHLQDLGPVLVGVAHLDPDGGVMASSAGALEEDPVPAFLDSIPRARSGDGGTRVHTGLFLPDGRAAAVLSHPIPGSGGGGPEGYVAAILSLDDLEPHLLGRVGRPPGESFLILDPWGHLLVHPVREWIGYLILTEADSLYDPELHAVLPELLGPEEGVWTLVSETLARDAWVYGKATAFAVAPLEVPGGERWKVGVAQQQESGFLLGLPGRVQLPLGYVLAALFLLALGVVLQGGRWRGWELKQVREERDWLRAMVEAEADGLIISQGWDGPLVGTNQEMARLLGVTPEALLGRSWGDLQDRPHSASDSPASDSPGADSPAAGALTPGTVEGRLRSARGDPVEVEVRTGAFFHRGREYVVALVRDLGWRRRLERETLRVGERERLLLGKELHDGLGQHLTGVAFMARTLARKLAGAHAREAEDVEAIGRLVKDAVGQIRVLSKGLELSEYEGHELPQALEEMSSVVGRLMGVSMELDLDPGLKNGDMKLDRGQATQLYRVCHDVVSDAVRNRMAQKVRIQIRKVEEGVLLSVQHDGAVQAQEAVGDRSLLSFRLRYRARLLDASLEMSQNPEGVTTVLCSVRVNGEQG